ncbi:MAG: hypothetical protein KF896_05990 [Ignavibacteriae bacterium]|nr:hypothetical protein [Ignavibacteriota bacterium]
MENSIIVRKYNLSDGDLALFANTLVIAMTRDLTEFESYGVTALKISDLNDLIDEFQALPDDDIYLADYSYAIEQRDELRRTIENVLRSISARAKSVYGNNTAKYRALKSGSITKLTDSEFLVEARQIHSSAETSLADLTAEGVTALYLTTLEGNIDDFETSIKTVSDKKIIRDDAAETKVLKGNELYSLVVKYCDYGKLIWNNVSPAKYNDYVIYESSSPGSLTAPTGLGFFFPNTNFFWDAVNNATSYNLEASTDGTDFFEIYSGAEPEFSYTPIQEGWMWYRVRARNAGGFGPFSEVFQLGYYPGSQLPTPVNLALQVETGTTNSLKLTWDVVPSATKYSVNKSVVPIGAAAGPFNLAKNVYSNEYFEEVDSGHRYYYNLTASNGNQWSSVSANVFIDMP